MKLLGKVALLSVVFLVGTASTASNPAKGIKFIVKEQKAVYGLGNVVKLQPVFEPSFGAVQTEGRPAGQGNVLTCEAYRVYTTVRVKGAKEDTEMTEFGLKCDNGVRVILKEVYFAR